jgi:hypothetical protein
MARFDRCILCDYSEVDGSPGAGIPPGRNGKVRNMEGDNLCDTCHRSISECYTELVGDEGD